MEQKGLSRRSFLQVMAGSAAAAITASVGPLSALAAQEMTYNEAPMLADLVASGDLPPVAERIPVNPRVITPYEEIGEYGGTWRRAFKGLSDRWGPTKLNEEMAIEWDMPDADTINLVANFISEWTQNDDASEFTFTLREGLKWSDGAPFTTQDVQFYYDLITSDPPIYNPPSQLVVSGELMELEVLDELSWKINFVAPNPLLPIFIAKSTLGTTAGPTMAAPKHYLERFLGNSDTADQEAIDALLEANGLNDWTELWYAGGVGDGQGWVPFWFRNPEVPIVNAWRSAVSPLTDPHLMERNPYYHAVDTEGNQLPYIDRITHTFFEDAENLALMIVQGQIDMQARHVSAADFTLFKENEEAGDYRVLLWRAASTNSYFPNISHPNQTLAQLFDTAEFREALSISINRQEINDLVYNGLLEVRQASPVSGSPEYDPEFETRWIEFDPDRANELLDGMGLTERDGNGFRIGPDGETIAFTITFSSAGFAGIGDEVNLVQQYWRDIGLSVNQELVERSLYESRNQAGEVEVGVWTVDRSSVVKADPTRMLGTVADGPWSINYARWLRANVYGETVVGTQTEPPADHPIRRIHELWAQVVVEPDEATRNALFMELLDIHKQHPYQIGILGEDPIPVIVKNNFVNVPNGFIWDDTLRSPGGAMPAQFSIRQQS